MRAESETGWTDEWKHCAQQWHVNCGGKKMLNMRVMRWNISSNQSERAAASAREEERKQTANQKEGQSKLDNACR